MGNYRECLKVLNDTKLIINDYGGHSCSFRTNLVSFKTFKHSLFPKPVPFLDYFCRFLQQDSSSSHTLTFVLFDFAIIHGFICFLVGLLLFVIFLKYNSVEKRSRLKSMASRWFQDPVSTVGKQSNFFVVPFSFLS